MVFIETLLGRTGQLATALLHGEAWGGIHRHKNGGEGEGEKWLEDSKKGTTHPLEKVMVKRRRRDMCRRRRCRNPQCILDVSGDLDAKSVSGTRESRGKKAELLLYKKSELLAIVVACAADADLRSCSGVALLEWVYPSDDW